MAFSVPLGHGDQLSGGGVYDGVLAGVLPGRAGCPGDAVAAGTAARPAATTVMPAAMATSLFMGMSPSCQASDPIEPTPPSPAGLFAVQTFRRTTSRHHRIPG